MYKVTRPFFAAEVQRVLNRGEAFDPADETRARELQRGGLIERKAVEAAPQNKDAAKLRKNK